MCREQEGRLRNQLKSYYIIQKRDDGLPGSNGREVRQLCFYPKITANKNYWCTGFGYEGEKSRITSRLLARGSRIAMALTGLGNMDGVAFWGEIKSSEMLSLRGQLLHLHFK